jgi:hypothetical protein
VRGALNYFAFDTATAPVNPLTGSVSSFNSDGYSSAAGTNININNTGTAIADYLWKKDAAYGVDVVSWTGNGVARTLAHSLGATPEMILVRNFSTSRDLRVYHAGADPSPQGGILQTNLQNAFAASSTSWNNTAPTPSVFSVGTDVGTNENTSAFTAWLFRSVTGFSKIGSYSGNGSTDGTFVHCGFRPAYLLAKNCSSGVTNWVVLDNKRNPANPLNLELLWNSNGAEGISTDADFVSSGFKVRTASSSLNNSGDRYAFVAFAETPFKYANAR